MSATVTVVDDSIHEDNEALIGMPKAKVNSFLIMSDLKHHLQQLIPSVMMMSLVCIQVSLYLSNS